MVSDKRNDRGQIEGNTGHWQMYKKGDIDQVHGGPEYRCAYRCEAKA